MNLISWCLVLLVTLTLTLAGCAKKPDPAPVTPPPDVVKLQVTAVGLTNSSYTARLEVQGLYTDGTQPVQQDLALFRDYRYTDDGTITYTVGTFSRHRPGERMVELRARLSLIGSSAQLSVPATLTAQWLVNDQPAVDPSAAFPARRTISTSSSTPYIGVFAHWFNYR